MLQWFQRLMPRQDVFFPAFERHAAVMVKAAVALREKGRRKYTGNDTNGTYGMAAKRKPSDDAQHHDPRSGATQRGGLYPQPQRLGLRARLQSKV